MFQNVSHNAKMRVEKMALKKIDIGNEIGRGWRLFQSNMGMLILAGVMLSVVASVTCFLLWGPLTAGMFLVARRLLKNDTDKPQAGDIFKGLDFFVQALLVSVIAAVAACVIGWIPVIGQLALLVIVAVATWAFMFVAYEKLTAIEAFKKVITLTQSGDLILPLVLVVIAGLIGGLGVIVCVVGVFFTIPITYCILACCYETLFSGEPEVIDPIQIEPPPPL